MDVASLGIKVYREGEDGKWLVKFRGQVGSAGKSG